ncbi:hypothetical protein BDN71DRAFT_1456450 [Pleurotus eryngii]|uniref:Uncharacterized protein n=1 Tax=Pleurotus eryngii TaxID=5323 RepID=A0A9P6DB43_PLEER|nr:hypothetical protein BDN71DRAFT_1456450 [Pleurotus eryngii]
MLHHQSAFFLSSLRTLSLPCFIPWIYAVRIPIYTRYTTESRRRLDHNRRLYKELRVNRPFITHTF